jgi:hypothetical protein
MHMTETKNPLQSLGIMGPLVTMVVWLINWKWPGIGIDEATIGAVIDKGALFVIAFTGVYGRYRARSVIKPFGA